MRDAFGGIVSIAIIVVFLVVVSGYLAFNVNYTKAFRVKNKIISTYEQYEGACYNPNADCRKIISKYMSEVGYYSGNMSVSSEEGFHCSDFGYSGYCVKMVKDGIGPHNMQRVHFEVITQINIEIPVINNIMGLRIFQVRGSTNSIEVESVPQF